MPPIPPDSRLVAYAQSLLKSGMPSGDVMARLSVRYPGLQPYQVDQVVGLANAIIDRANVLGSAPPGTTLGEHFPMLSGDSDRVTLDALVAFRVGNAEPTYRTLRFEVPWTVTISDYEAGIMALAILWAQGGTTGPATLPGGASIEVEDPLQRVMPHT